MYQQVQEKDLPARADLNYGPEWKMYAGRRRVAIFLLSAGAPVCVAAWWITRSLIDEPLLSIPVMLVWWALAGGAVWWAGEIRCPRCRRRYGASSAARKGVDRIWRGLFDPICFNCKLRKFEE